MGIYTCIGQNFEDAEGECEGDTRNDAKCRFNFFWEN